MVRALLTSFPVSGTCYLCGDDHHLCLTLKTNDYGKTGLAEDSAIDYDSANCFTYLVGGAVVCMSRAILHSCQYQNYRRIDLIVVHCSATRCTSRVPLEMITKWHQERGFATIGYHFYITQDGDVHRGRPLHQVGAHAMGFNEHSIGVCYEGGLDAEGRPADTRTPAQKESLRLLLERLMVDYPHAKVLGHRDLPGVRKVCPCFAL